MSKSILTLKLLSFATVALFSFSASSAKAQDVAEITLTADKVQFIYDLKEFTVKAGQKVKLILVNPADSVTRQPHNILIVKKGKKEAVGALANAGLADADFLTKKNCIPESDDILFHSNLVLPGKSETIEFTAPSEPGDYPYLCTYPGHWILMNGVMKVK
ncbi:MAG: plastocyanin/azurin family copper-binding protein [Verrucomicrobiota bacterium]